MKWMLTNRRAWDREWILGSFAAAAMLAAGWWNPAATRAADPIGALPPVSQDRSYRASGEQAATGQAYLGVSTSAGPSGEIQVKRVVPASPAEDAGVRAGDQILSLDGQSLSSDQQFTRTIHALRPNATVQLGIRRDGNRRTLTATLIDRGQFVQQGTGSVSEGVNRVADTSQDRAEDIAQGVGNAAGAIGQTVRDIRRSIRAGVRQRAGYNEPYADDAGRYESGYAPNRPQRDDRYGQPPREWRTPGAALGAALRPGDQGVVVAKVYAAGPAADANLRSGDEIVRADGQLISSLRSLARVISEHQPGDPIEFEIHRNGRSLTFEITLPEHGEYRQAADGAVSDRVREMRDVNERERRELRANRESTREDLRDNRDERISGRRNARDVRSEARDERQQTRQSRTAENEDEDRQ